LSGYPIATAGRLATVGAGIQVVLVAIVAGLANLKVAITAGRFDFTDHDFGATTGDEHERKDEEEAYHGLKPLIARGRCP
jgi:hypothetical protein